MLHIQLSGWGCKMGQTHVAHRTGSSTSHVKVEKFTHSQVARISKYCINWMLRNLPNRLSDYKLPPRSKTMLIKTKINIFLI